MEAYEVTDALHIIHIECGLSMILATGEYTLEEIVEMTSVPQKMLRKYSVL